MPQSLSNVLVHLVFSTKHRDPCLTEAVCEELYPYMITVLRSNDCPCIRIGGVEDNVHLLFALSRKTAIAHVVEKVKTSSSKWMKGKVSYFSWQAGYGAFSVGVHEVEAATKYIQTQVTHHRKVSFQDEYRALLAEAGIPFDERHVWD